MTGNVITDFFNYFIVNGGYIFELFFNHLLMSIYGVIFASAVGIPIGILIARFSKLSGLIITLTNIIQTIPVIAMLAIMMLEIGRASCRERV